jgi:hypothetical protein
MGEVTNSGQVTPSAAPMTCSSVKRLFVISVLLIQEHRHNFWIRIPKLGQLAGKVFALRLHRHKHVTRLETDHRPVRSQNDGSQPRRIGLRGGFALAVGEGLDLGPARPPSARRANDQASTVPIFSAIVGATATSATKERPRRELYPDLRSGGLRFYGRYAKTDSTFGSDGSSVRVDSITRVGTELRTVCPAPDRRTT